MSSSANVSVFIPVKNEEENLPGCLATVQWADEVFVIDSQSSDCTVEAAEGLGAKVYQFLRWFDEEGRLGARESPFPQ